MNIALTPPSTGQVTQWYGNGSNRGIHSGNDYAYSSGGKIHDQAYAMHDGVVEFADDTRKLGWPNRYYFNPDFDRSDKYDHSAGIVVALRADEFPGITTYCHLETTWLNPGDRVKRGDAVGIVGQTGFSLGKHLHAELLLDGADFTTSTGGRSDLNKYMVATVATPKEKDWFDMATKAELEEIIDRKLNEKLATFKPGITGKNHHGEHYNALMTNLRSLLTNPEVMDAQALHLLKRPINLIDPSAETGKITGTTTLATKANWEAYNFQKALKAIAELGTKLNVHMATPKAVTESTVESVPK